MKQYIKPSYTFVKFEITSDILSISNPTVPSAISAETAGALQGSGYDDIPDTEIKILW